MAVFVSWFGSYQRLQGTYSFLSYVLIGVLTAATLRRPEQLRRLQHAIIVTSLACSIYGVVQHYESTRCRGAATSRHAWPPTPATPSSWPPT